MLTNDEMKALETAQDILDRVFEAEETPKQLKIQASLASEKVEAVTQTLQKQAKRAARMALREPAAKATAAAEDGYEEA